MNQRERAAEQVRFQEKHDRYVIELDRVTAKAPHEMTREEFRWLIGRFIMPAGQSIRSLLRQKFLEELVGDFTHRFYRRAEREIERTNRYPRFFPRLNTMQAQAWHFIRRNKTAWPS